MSTDTRPTRRERRDQRREEERIRREQQARRSRTTRLLALGGIALLVVLGAALAYRPLSDAMTRQAAQGQMHPSQGSTHIAAGAAHEPYNTNPPTSGPHYENWARWGVYDAPLIDEQLVHNLEHGGIVVHYNCPNGCPELVTQLKDLLASERKVILAPRTNPGVPCRITLTAWQYLDCFDDFDAGRIKAFISAHRSQPPAPEPFVDT